MTAAKNYILVIEDDAPIREMLKSVLELEGYQVETANNGKQGIAAISAEVPPQVILLDMMMPVSSGWDVLDFLRANAETAKVPVVIVSAYSEVAKSVRPNAFVPKPVQLKSLLGALEQCQVDRPRS
ncbi:MAG: response regulator [Bdellovibrionota bacterium]